MIWYREPLVHFLGIGALLFGAFALVNDEVGSVAENRIEITASNVERLREVWSKQWNRQPTETELKGLINSHIREEVLYREGLALGLDKNDTIIRRRLAQKMEFLFEDLAIQGKPTEEDLKAYFDRNKDKYLLPARKSFCLLHDDVRAKSLVEPYSEPHPTAAIVIQCGHGSGRDGCHSLIQSGPARCLSGP